MSLPVGHLGHILVDKSDAASLATALRAWLDRCPSGMPIKPDHRKKLRWPPPSTSHRYHVLATDWRGEAALEIHGERLPVQVASGPYGVFGRCESIWLEARGDSQALMLQNMAVAAEPFFKKALGINAVLGESGRFRGHVEDLDPLSHLKLLFAEDRDIADDGQVEIEKHARTKLFGPALIEVLRDRRHRCRRTAQWCVLDLFEELPAYCRDADEERLAVAAMKALMWDAEDDYARAVFKAGVVIGGHLSETYGGPVLIECLAAPSRIGRRSAIHGLFHVVEWVPELRDSVAATLRDHATAESDPLLAEFSLRLAADIESESVDHGPEPVFDGE
ncbi:MAG: hypothetical protein ACYC96_04940 [Fimbriimonadaceae bacterium]